jgi:phosphoglycolate phosphatase
LARHRLGRALASAAAEEGLVAQRLHLVIFDCDGTLVDSFVANHEAMVLAFRDFDRSPPPEAGLREMIGLSVAEQVVVLAPQAPPDEWLALENSYRQHRLGRADPPEPMFPGARACLEAIDRDDILMAVATAKSAKGLRATLDRHGLHRHFVNLQTGDHHPGKPHPAMVLASLAEAGVDPENALVVGDTRFDIEMAVNAGVASFGVAWGYHNTQDLTAAGAHAIAPDFETLTKMIGERFSLA